MLQRLADVKPNRLETKDKRMFMAGDEVTLSAAQLQEILNAAYVAEGNGDVEFDADMIDVLNDTQRRLDTAPKPEGAS
jgi:hypothetical protein